MNQPLNVKLNAKITGSGHALILLHGLLGSLENLGAIATLLSTHFTVHNIDLPNHGKSFHSSTASLDLMAQAIADYIEASSLENVYIAGHSLGGKVAMQLALDFPHLVAKLVVIDISPRGYGHEMRHEDIFDGLLSFFPADLKSRSEADALLKPYVPQLAVRSFLLKNLIKNDQGKFTWRCNVSLLSIDYPALVEENVWEDVFSKPTLFLAANLSDYIQEQDSVIIEEAFSNAQVIPIDGVGHWMHAEKPQEISEKIIDFLIFSDVSTE